MNQRSTFHYFIAFFITFAYLPQQAQAQCDPRRDSLALVALFDATGGNNWTIKTNWKVAGQPIGTWYGITTDAGGCVTSVNLVNNALNGVLPNLNLLNLKQLNLAVNQLSGTIPNFNLPNLQYLYLFGNQLNGAIPNFNLSNLLSLSLGDNRLSDNIPNFNLPKLERLLLGKNQLNGSIPNFNMPNLQFLQIFDNQLTGNIPNFNMLNLQYLTLYNNILSDSIPNFNLPNLLSLSLGNNQLGGGIPTFDLPKLEELSLPNNHLRGYIPNVNLPNLKSLILSNNLLVGRIQNFNFPKLLALLFNGNQIDSCPKFTNIPSLSRSQINGNGGLNSSYNKLSFDDILPNMSFIAISTFTYAPQDSIFKDTTYNRTINDPLSINLNIDDTVTTNIYKWYKNNVLYRTITVVNKLVFNTLQTTDAGVYRCEVTNPNAPLLTLLSRKATVRVLSCRENDSIELVKLYNATNGTNWSVRDTNGQKSPWVLSQPINTWFGIRLNTQGCVDVIDLDGIANWLPDGGRLIGNGLKGSLPNLNLPELTTLILDDNRLNGRLPKFDSLPKLEILSLFNNITFRGTGIDEFKYLLNLKRLELGYCYFGGLLPLFNNLPNLIILGIGGNDFTDGLINVAQLKKLTSFSAENNLFTDSIPQTVLNLPLFGRLTIYNNRLLNIGKTTNPALLLNIERNKLTFDDIVANAKILSTLKYTYTPQDSIFKDTTYQNTEGGNFTINLGIDDTVTTNIYKWFKDGTLYRTVNGSNKLIFFPLLRTDAGIYTCQVTNSNAPLLTLYSRKATLIVKNCLPIKTDAIDDNITVNETNATEFTVTDNDRFDAAAQLSVTLLKKPQYGTLTNLNNGKFRYESMPILRGVTQFIKYQLCNTLCPNDCDSAQVTIDIQGVSPVQKASKGITPQNQDGKNDVLEFDETEDVTRYPESELIIYNRWNDIVFRAKPYLNNWDGNRNGQPLPAGTYYYILHLNQKEGKTLTGDVTIIR